MNSIRPIWTIHLITLVILVLWSTTDPSFVTMVRLRSFSDALLIVGWVRVAALTAATGVAAISLLALVLQTFRRSTPRSRSRSVRQLLTIAAVTALWCSLAIHHDALAWQGKRARFAFRVGELEAIAKPLRSQWPDRDGEHATIGPFMAYPFGHPRTLILLHAPRISRQSVYVSAIERCTGGAIKLQLTGADGGDWAEWHPQHSRPTSFVGGLADPHHLLNATAIGSGWYLVRYKT